MKKYLIDDKFDKVLDINEDCYIINTSKNFNLSQKVVLNNSKRLNIFIFDFTEESNIELNFDLYFNASLNLYYGGVKTSKENKLVKFNIDHKEGLSNSFVEMIGLNYNEQNKMYFEMNATIQNTAKKSSTRVEGKIINLLEKCNSSVLPVLKIYENDVKASHGAALGSVDTKMIYYLTSRGISEENAKKLLTYGYFTKIINLLDDTDAKNRLNKLLFID